MNSNSSVALPDDLRIAFTQSCWHRDIVDRAWDGFTEIVGDQAAIERFEVPGAFELPLLCQRLAATGRFSAVVAAGFVVDGGIYRHEFVADAVIKGLMQVQLAVDVPVFSVVLTPQMFHEHQDHSTFFTNHMIGKGREAAESCLATLRTHQALASA